MRMSGNTRRNNIRRALSVFSAALILPLFLTACADGQPEYTGMVTEETTDAATTRAVITSPETLPGFTSDTEETTDEVTTTKPVTTKAQETEPEPDPVRLSFIGMGDNIVYNVTYNQSKKSDGTYDFLPKYKRVEPFIKNADIAFINQETPMCGEKYGYSSYPQFNTPDQMGYDLITLGFDIICFANNHMADMGYNSKKCIADMMDFTDTLDAFILGLYRDFEDFDNIRVYEKEGVKIAFLAYTYGTNLYKQQSEPERIEGAYIPVYNEELIKHQVEKAKEISDFVFVSIHWGKENSHTVTEEQENYAQLMADLGVDVILGHHPHVIQKIEWLEGQGGNKTLCYYSLGNGLNAQDYLKNMVGITASFDIVKDKDGCRIENASCIPTFNVMTASYKNISLIPLDEMTDEIAEKHHCNNKESKRTTVKRAYDIVRDNIAPEFLPDYLK